MEPENVQGGGKEAREGREGRQREKKKCEIDREAGNENDNEACITCVLSANDTNKAAEHPVCLASRGRSTPRSACHQMHLRAH